MESSDRKVCVSVRTGGSIVRCRPIFSADSRLLICASGCVINIYNVESDICGKSLRHHTADVTSIVLNPSNQFQILSSSLDQTIILWDYVDGMMLHQFKFRWSINSIFPSADDPCSFYGIFHAQKDSPNGDLGQFTLQKHAPQSSIVAVNIVVRGLQSDVRLSAIGCQRAYIAYVKKGSTVEVFDLKHSTNYEVKLPLTVKCIACHPTLYILAAGCKTGKIFICRSFLGRQSEVVITTLHWHALDVCCLTFSTEGSYLLSGGYECVLAKWLTEATIRKPETLPRLSAPIVNLSCSADNQLYAVCYIDNGIQVIRSNFTRGQTIQGLVQGHHEHHRQPASTGLLYDPRTTALVLNGRPGQLQFFNVTDNRQLFSLNVVGHNYVSPENLERPLILTDVENAAFDESGEWLATVERRDDGVTTVEIRLKFWSYSKEKNCFVLNTCVEKPHPHKVNCLKFCPHPSSSDDRPLVAVTSSSDGMFKVWSLTDTSDIYKTSINWSCSLAGYYRAKPAGQFDFSDDGSVLAVAFKDTITLWDPESNTMNTDVISLANQQVDIRHVAFGRKNCSHLILFTTHNALYSWNLLSFSVQWSLPLTVSSIAVNPSTGLAAVFTQEHHLYVMSATTSHPVYRRLSIATTPVIASNFVPNCPVLTDVGELSWQNEARLYFMTDSQEICGLFYSDEIAAETSGNIKLEQTLPHSVLSMLVAKQTLNSVQPSRLVSHEDQLARTNSKFVDELLRNPLHGMPPMSVLCMSFIESLLIKKKSLKSGNSSDSESDDDVDEIVAAESAASSSEDEVEQASVMDIS